MSTPFEDLARLDRMIHEPARLAITTALASCDGADFLFLQNLTGLTKGNLSSHLSRLEKAEIVLVQKGFDGKVPRTWIELTPRGREILDRYWRRIDEISRATRGWDSSRSE